jgi:hypothetical protein
VSLTAAGAATVSEDRAPRNEGSVVEESLEEALLALVVRLVMTAEGLMAPAVMIPILIPVVVVIVVVWAAVVPRSPVAGGGGRLARAPAGLGIDETLQLTAIEEEPAAVRALIDVHAVPLVLPHLAMALRTGQGAHAEPNGPCGARVPKAIGGSLQVSNGV